MQRVGAWVVWASLLSSSCTANLHDAETAASADPIEADQPELPATEVSSVQSAAELPQAIEEEEPSVDMAEPEMTNEAPAELPEEVAPPAPPQALCQQRSWPGLSDLHLTQPAQYVALRVRGQTRDALETTELASWGTRCVEPSDPVACEIDVVNAEDSLAYETTVCDPICKQIFLVTAQDGVPQTFGNGSAVRALLGTVDTRSEAVLLAFYSVKGVDLSCAAADPSLVKPVRGGYELPVRLRQEDTCSLAGELAIVQVESTGRVQLTRTGERVADESSCP